MADAPDGYARGMAMATQAVLRHLFLHLEEKHVVTAPERDQIISDAIADHVHPQETPFESQAVAILQELKRALSGSGE